MADPPQEELDWVRIKKEIGSSESEEEAPWKKLKRKTMENPLVPFGALLTTAALTCGLYAMKTGQQKMSQMMMRARIIAQGFTIAALCGGVIITAIKTGDKKELTDQKIEEKIVG